MEPNVVAPTEAAEFDPLREIEGTLEALMSAAGYRVWLGASERDVASLGNAPPKTNRSVGLRAATAAHRAGLKAIG